MGFFKKTKKSGCWIAIVPQRDGFAVANVAYAGADRPVVESAAFFPGEGNAEVLERIGRETRAAAHHCTTLLGVGEYQLLSVEAPNVPGDELKTAVRWRLKDMLDFPVNDATIDVLRIPTDPHAASRAQQMIFVVAARNSILAPRQQMFSTAKVGLGVVDIPEMAQRNIAALLEPEGRGLAVLSFDADGALLTVTHGGELYLARRIDIPLDVLSDPDHDRRHQGFDRITLELQRSLDNFERQFSFISISRLLLAPNSIEGLDAYLSSNLYTPVDSLDLGHVFDLDRVPELADKSQQQRFFTALGAGLRREGVRA
jgi:MSHA biogenesis protein MshI